MAAANTAKVDVAAIQKGTLLESSEINLQDVATGGKQLRLPGPQTCLTPVSMTEAGVMPLTLRLERWSELLPSL